MPTTPYLTTDEFKVQALIPSSWVDELEIAEPGWTLKRLIRHTAWINSKLSKRYAAPFAAPYPEAVIGWLESLTTLDVMLRRGVDASDKQFQSVEASAAEARSDVSEAADSVTGLFDLPLRADTNATGISKGGPLFYSEQSPYVSLDEQRRIGVQEDAQGRGSNG